MININKEKKVQDNADKIHRCIEEIEEIVKKTGDETDLLKKRTKLFYLYSELSDASYEVSPCKIKHKINGKNIYIIRDGGKYTSIENVYVNSSYWLNRLNTKYIYPITIELSDLNEKEAKERERSFFKRSVTLSVTFSFIVSALFYFLGTFFNNTNDLLKVYHDEIVNNQKIILNNVDYNSNINKYANINKYNHK